jgi:hypothetical protein
MAKHRKRPPKDSLQEERELDRRLREAIFESIRTTPVGLYVVVQLPPKLLHRLRELNERHEQQSQDN